MVSTDELADAEEAPLCLGFKAILKILTLYQRRNRPTNEF
jgi:hypothetical protein